MVFQFVVLQMRMHSLLFGPQTCMVYLKLPHGLYYISAKSKLISIFFSCAGAIVLSAYGLPMSPVDQHRKYNLIVVRQRVELNYKQKSELKNKQL